MRLKWGRAQLAVEVLALQYMFVFAAYCKSMILGRLESLYVHIQGDLAGVACVLSPSAYSAPLSVRLTVVCHIQLTNLSLQHLSGRFQPERRHLIAQPIQELDRNIFILLVFCFWKRKAFSLAMHRALFYESILRERGGDRTAFKYKAVKPYHLALAPT